MPDIPVAKLPGFEEKYTDKEYRVRGGWQRWIQMVDAAVRRLVTVQAQSDELDTISALTPADDDVLQRKAGEWANRTMAQLWADLVPTVTVGTIGTAAGKTGQLRYVSDETGGAIHAFSDGADWRRVTDRAVVS